MADQQFRLEARYPAVSIGIEDSVHGRSFWTKVVSLDPQHNDVIVSIRAPDGTLKRVRVITTESASSTTVTICQDVQDIIVQGSLSLEEGALPKVSLHSNLEINLNILGLGVSIIDTQREEELINLSIGSVKSVLRHSVQYQALHEPLQVPAFPSLERGTSETIGDVTIGVVQVDNLFKGSAKREFPVLLCHDGTFLKAHFTSNYVDPSTQKGGNLAFYKQEKCESSHYIGDPLPSSGLNPCTSIEQAKEIAVHVGYTLGEDCRYIQLCEDPKRKDGVKAYFYREGTEGGRCGPATWQFDRNLDKYPQVGMEVQMGQIDVGLDSDLIMRFLSRQTTWGDILKPSIDPRSSFLHLVPSAAPDWVPYSLCFVKKMIIMAMRWDLSLSFTSDAIAVLAPSVPRLVRGILLPLGSVSLTDFPIKTSNYIVSNTLMPPDAMPGKIGEGIGAQIEAVKFASVSTVVKLVASRIRGRGQDDGMVRMARKVKSDSPIEILDQRLASQTIAFVTDGVTAGVAMSDEHVRRASGKTEHCFYVFENQRWLVMQGWSAKHLFPTERGNLTAGDGVGDYQWTARHGEGKEPAVSCPDGWNWTAGWQIQKGKTTDKDGWQYSSVWGLTFYPKAGFPDTIRRRVWLRNMAKI